jgi:nickel/cobalt transporter (NicO) family protein
MSEMVQSMTARLRRVRLAFVIAMTCVVIVAAPCAVVIAAEELPSQRSPFAFGAHQADAQSTAPSGIARTVDVAWRALLQEQHKLTQEMTSAVRDIKTTTSLTAATSALVMVSFVYGIFHAAGPGHGKAVISSYMLADKQTLRRGVFLAFLSSLIQALSAIVLIGSLFLAAKATGLETRKAEAWLETASWGCVALLGAWLMLAQVWRAVVPNKEAPPARDPATGLLLKPAEPFEIVHPKPHVHDEHCNHVHLPPPSELKGAFSWSQALALAFSIGIRPCTGALLVIVFAAAQGLLWAGILATFAMAAGTAITVSALAALSVGSRDIAVRLAGNGGWAAAISQGATFVSAAIVFLMGSAFFVASLTQPLRPF